MEGATIVLAVRNGTDYLEAFIASLKQQTHSDWRLLVRDDASTDGTAELVRRLATEDHRICLLESDRRQLGALGSFSRLLQRAYDCGAQYVFTADHDDLWHPQKLELQLAELRRAENSEQGCRPTLVYSDLTVVDQRSQVVAESFFRCSRLRHGQPRALETLLGRSFVLGCACAVNRQLLDFALPVPQCVPMHDWWLALCAAAVGQIVEIPQPLVQYRRHGGNDSGPASFWSGFNPLRYSWRTRWQKGFNSFRRALAQAQELRKRLAQRQWACNEGVRETLEQYCDLFAQHRSRLRTVYELSRRGMPPIDLPRRLIYYLCVLKLGPSQSCIRMEQLPCQQNCPLWTY